MVYNYVRKTNRASWSEEALKAAMNEAKRSNIKQAAQKYGISYSVLQRRVKTGCSKKSLGRYKPIFTKDEELELVKHLKDLDAIFYGLTKSEFLEMVGEFAARKNKHTSFKNKVAGKQWYKNFKKRHPEIVLRTPESTSIARLQAFNKPAVNRFYDLLESTIAKENIRTYMIYNMDETGVRTSSTRPPKVISVYGKKQVGMVSSLEKGTLTTIVCCCSASGNFAPPPFFIFKRKRFQARLLDGSMPGCEASVSDSGWINGEIFLHWLRVFVNCVRPTQDCKALLLLDNHESHKFYPALQYATENNVVFLTIPPHTSHKLQPLDVAVYSPFKTFFEIEINKFHKQHPGRVICQYDIARLVTSAYLKAATPQNALSGFRAAGIQPFDRHAIGDEYYAPSNVYNRELETQEHDLADYMNPVAVTESVPKQIFAEDTDVTIASSDVRLESPLQRPERVSKQIPTDRLSPRSETAHIQPENIHVTEPMEIQPAPSNERVLSELNTPDIVVQRVDETTTPPKNQSILHEIRPLPENTKKNTNRRRPPQRSEILTSTPIKTQQKDKFEKSQIKKGDISKADKKKTRQKKDKLNSMPSTSSGQGRKTKYPKTKDKENDYYCIVCREKFVSPPNEDWIQCSQCQEWSHESCTAYSGCGSFFCDLCFD